MSTLILNVSARAASCSSSPSSPSVLVSGVLHQSKYRIGINDLCLQFRTSCWLHPRYPEIVRLLDAEIMRVILRPRQEDHKLETVQALILCAHWMPLDISADRERYRSRFSEAGAWHCLGLAIRWAISLELERTCCASFQRPESVTRADAQRFRTMLYLTESDH